MTNTAISVDFPYQSHYVDIDGSKLHYIEQGTGNPIVFLHGIPASSYLWRNVIPHLSTLGRCIAPDLIGFGKSDKPAIQYTITDHIRYIEKFIEALNLNHITFVLHGWGSIVGLDYAMKHENKCKGLVFYESYLRPQNGEEVSLPYQEQILKWQGKDNISELLANGVQFVDDALLQGTVRKLSEKEMNYYREPFQQSGSEKPIHQYLRDLPGLGNQTSVDKIIAAYSARLMASKLPKLLLYSIPGFITTVGTIKWAKEHLQQLEMVDIGEDLHYIQESNPALMGETISVWLQSNL